jgi:hypothetical protein
MQPFRRVEAHKAGPTALGILVPPGQRTLVILRPRALPWDLLPGHWEEATGQFRFCDFSRDEAAGVARTIQRQLVQHALDGANPLEVCERTDSKSFRIWLNQKELAWVVCPRRPGQPYEEMIFITSEEAQDAVRRIAACMIPLPGSDQEIYFNTQHFSR